MLGRPTASIDTPAMTRTSARHMAASTRRRWRDPRASAGGRDGSGGVAGRARSSVVVTGVLPVVGGRAPTRAGGGAGREGTRSGRWAGADADALRSAITMTDPETKVNVTDNKYSWNLGYRLDCVPDPAPGRRPLPRRPRALAPRRRAGRRLPRPGPAARRGAGHPHLRGGRRRPPHRSRRLCRPAPRPLLRPPPGGSGGRADDEAPQGPPLTPDAVQPPERFL